MSVTRRVSPEWWLIAAGIAGLTVARAAIDAPPADQLVGLPAVLGAIALYRSRATAAPADRASWAVIGAVGGGIIGVALVALSDLLRPVIRPAEPLVGGIQALERLAAALTGPALVLVAIWFAASLLTSLAASVRDPRGRRRLAVRALGGAVILVGVALVSRADLPLLGLLAVVAGWLVLWVTRSWSRWERSESPA